MCIIYPKMRQNAPFWGNSPKNSRGRSPNPHLREGVTPSSSLPLSASASVKPSASDPGAPAILNCAPEEKKWHPCGTIK